MPLKPVQHRLRSSDDPGFTSYVTGNMMLPHPCPRTFQEARELHVLAEISLEDSVKDP